MNSPGQWADDDQRVGGQPPLFKKPLKIRPFDPRPQTPPDFPRKKRPGGEGRNRLSINTLHAYKVPFFRTFQHFPCTLRKSPFTPRY